MSDYSFIMKRIPRRGIPEKYQRLVPLALEDYLKGNPPEEARKKYWRKEKAYVGEIYKRIEFAIKELSIEKMARITGQHKEFFRQDEGFADAVLTYCTLRGNKKLEKALLDSIGEEHRRFVKTRYKKNVRQTGDIRNVKELVKEQGFYLFIAENILTD